MLVSEIPALREFWYPVIYSAELTDKPHQAVLFGEEYVVWRTGDGAAHAAFDLCPHRGARLSQGWLSGDRLVCGYHGWQYDSSGRCVCIPQNDPATPIPRRASLQPVHADERYEMVWICIAEEPRAPIPDLPELNDPDYVLIHEMMEVWDAAAPRVVDNALDVSHLSFVHRGSIGDAAAPRMSDYDLERDGWNLSFTISYQSRVTEQQKRNTGITDDFITRTTHAELVQPMVFRGVLEYPNDLRHVLYKTCAPVDDHRTLFCQFVARNDDPDDEKARGIIGVDRTVQCEDRALLERMPSDFPAEVTTEVHTKGDRMTLEYRRILADLAAESGPLRPDATWAGGRWGA